MNFSADAIRFNPYTLAAEVEGITLGKEGETPLCKARRLYVNLSLVSLFKLGPVVSDAVLEDPEISLVLKADGTLDLPVLPAAEQNSPEAEEMFPFRVSEFSLTNGKITLQDRLKNLTHTVDDLNLTLHLISSFDGETGNPARGNARFDLNKAPVVIQASALPFQPDMSAQASIQVDGLSLTPFWSYASLPETLAITSHGRLNCDINLAYANAANTAKAGGGEGSSHHLSIMGRADILEVMADAGVETGAAGFSSLSLDLGTKDLFNQGLELSRIRLLEPVAALIRDSQGRMPLLTLFDTKSGTDAEPDADAGLDRGSDADAKIGLPIPVAVTEAVLEKGRFLFRDMTLDKGGERVLSPVSIRVENLIAEKNLSMDIDANAVTQSGETFGLKTRLSIDQGVGLKGTLSATGVKPDEYAGYTRPYVKDGIKIAAVDLASAFDLTLADGLVQGRFSGGQLKIAGIALISEDLKHELFRMEKILLEGIDIDLTQREIRIRNGMSGQGQLTVKRMGRTGIDLLNRLADFIPQEGPGPAEAVSGSPWAFTLDAFGLKEVDLGFTDMTKPDDPVTIKVSDVTVKAAQITTQKGQKGQIQSQMVWQKQGRINVNGEVSLSESRARVDVNLSKIDIKSFQPYFTDYLNIEISDGMVQSKGRLQVSWGKGPLVNFKGETGLSDLSTQGKITGQDFFKCKSLYVSGMDVNVLPTAVTIKEIALTDYYAKAILYDTGKSNFQMVLAKEEEERPTDPTVQANPEQPAASRKDEAKTESSAASPYPPVLIEAITLQGGHINFTDLFTTPNYTANMTQVAGSVTNLSTGPDPAEITLKGVHGLYSPMDLTGAFNPFGSNRMADLALSFKNIELREFNAYAKKYLGYEIEKGKLILDLNYKIKGAELDSVNRLYFDQLTLGEKVESEHATKLPIDLAISLLKNSEGAIDLDIPIKGNLDDPEFSFADVFADAFANFFTKIISAPFKFLGALVKGYDEGELGYVVFSPGHNELDRENLDKLDQLSKILFEKDKLILEIRGGFDPELDGDVIRQQRLAQQLLAMAPSRLSDDEKNALLNSDKRKDLVKKAYARAEFPKPRDEDGKEKRLTAEEMEKLLITHIAVAEHELRSLAVQRSNHVVDYLMGSGKLSAERVYTHEPDPADKESQEGQTIKTLFLLR